MSKPKLSVPIFLATILMVSVSSSSALLDLLLGKPWVKKCENQVVKISCNVNQFIEIVDVETGRDSLRCFSRGFKNEVCQTTEKTKEFIKSVCDDQKKCSININASIFDPQCLAGSRYLKITYNCKTKKIDCNSNPCGFGAICRNGLFGPVCSCPSGTSGDPDYRCCNPLRCSCFGDPHCTTFDKAKFDFMGQCKYDLVSTECKGKTLPKDMIPFSVTQKQERRGTGPNSKKVSYIRFIDVNVFGNIYRLLQKSKGKLGFTMNGINMVGNYNDEFNGLRIYISAGSLIFITNFGLMVKWNGVHKAEVTICSYYADYVCGLCGNADGKKENDFVDRENNLVDVSSSDYYTRFFEWGSKWRVLDDTADGSQLEECVPERDSGQLEPIKCTNDYSGTEWCGLMKSRNGPWRICISYLSKEILDQMYDACLFDTCALENDPISQKEFKCKAFEEFTQKCYESLSFLSQINWRPAANCPITCGLNQEYTKPLTSTCPKTCFNSKGNYDCGFVYPEEGCHCSKSTVLNSKGDCVPLNQCGCQLPENMGILDLGSILKSSDCTARYTCERPNGNVTVELLPPCGGNASCIGDINNEPFCVCNEGFVGDGFNCFKIEPLTTTKLITTKLTTRAVDFENLLTIKELIGCENQQLNLACSVDTFLNIIEASYGRSSLSACSSVTMSNELCSPLDVSSIVRSKCNQKRRCQVMVNSNTFGRNCQSVSKYLQVKYQCIKRPPLPDPCSGNPCGFGAFCRNANGFPVCSCPAGTNGDAKIRCCRHLKCGCWGDPHCTTFDNAKFDFMGKCKYDLVTTDCFNQTLPEGMIPFSIHQKQETRNGREYVAYVAYVEINVFNQQFRLLKKNGNRHRYTINGIIRPNNYVDNTNGVRIYVSGANLVFSTTFGLTVTWNGNHKVDVILCDTYAKHVCGLCGNGDGLVSNDFVDKANSLVNSDGKFYNRTIFFWANKWRVPDDSIESDKALCNANNDPGPEPEPVKCKNETVYRNYEWCGVIRNYQGPWAECLLKIDPVLLEGIYEGCLFDLCASEENKTLQNEYRCKAYEQITSVCSGLLGSLINWRIKVKCPADCGPNEIYVIRKECPKTCIDQLGENDCGELNYAEGCFCKDSYVRNSLGQCIDLQECGCILPGGSVDLSYGEIFQPNCSVRFVCDGLSGQLNVEDLRSCSTNAVCLADRNNQPNCVCIQGFVGDGFICERETTQVITTTSEHFEFSLLDLEFTDYPITITTTETQNTKINTRSFEESNENTYSTTKIPCFEDMVIYENENQLNFSDTFVNGTSRCGLSNDPFYFEELLDLEFSECETGSVCYGFGDPHYRTFDGDKFSVNKTCPYVLATDFCPGNSEFKFIIYVDHEHRYSNDKAIYMKLINIYFNKKFYTITKELTVNTVPVELPYVSENENIFVRRENHYIVFQTNFFTIHFDGDQMLKLHQCNDIVCGICGNNNGNPFDDSLKRSGYMVQIVERACLFEF